MTDPRPFPLAGQAFGTAAGGTAGAAQPALPEALRGFLERLGQGAASSTA